MPNRAAAGQLCITSSSRSTSASTGRRWIDLYRPSTEARAGRRGPLHGHTFCIRVTYSPLHPSVRPDSSWEKLVYNCLLEIAFLPQTSGSPIIHCPVSCHPSHPNLWYLVRVLPLLIGV